MTPSSSFSRVKTFNIEKQNFVSPSLQYNLLISECHYHIVRLDMRY